jgi:molybdopterin/thiamine biosynthesis adenylyltransferase
MERYSRQKDLVCQEKIEKLEVYVCGLGGIGSFVAFELVCLGVGKIVLIDKDKVSLSDLNRQILYSEKDIGKFKAEAAKKRLSELNSAVKIEGLNKDVSECRDIISKEGMVFDCLDNWQSRFLLDDFCHQKNAILIHGAASHFKGHVYVHKPNTNPCLKEIFKKVSQMETRIVSPTCATIASLMIFQLLKFLNGEDIFSYILFFDGRRDKLEKVEVRCE